MNFDNEKKQALSKIDKSKKGSIDRQIRPLVEKINKHKDYFTTSSCAGRIMLLIESERKDKVKWMFSSHEAVLYAEIEKVLSDMVKLPQKTLWLRMEPPIIHIRCRNRESAEKLMKMANNSGFRRSAIIAVKRLVVELNFTEKMDVPIAGNSELMVDETYLKKVIGYANSKLKETRKKLKKLRKLFP